MFDYPEPIGGGGVHFLKKYLFSPAPGNVKSEDIGCLEKWVWYEKPYRR